MKISNLCIIIILVLISEATTITADVHMSDVYYTSGNAVSDSMTLHNVDYKSGVMIFPTVLVDNSKAGPVDGSEDCWLEDSTGNDAGSCLKIEADKFEYNKISFADGLSNAVINNYKLESGLAQAKYFNGITSIREIVSSKDNEYQSCFVASRQGLYSSSFGWPTRGKYSGFYHEISMTHAGKSCKIESELSCSDEVSGEIPVQYSWDALTGSDDVYAMARIGISASDGDRDVDFCIDGESSYLTDKHSGPEHIDAVESMDKRVSKDVYMMYEIIR